jgi:hypothetical protein
MSTGAISSGVKRPWREADHSPPTSAKVKINWSIKPLCSYALWHGPLWVKHRDNFNILLRLDGRGEISGKGWNFYLIHQLFKVGFVTTQPPLSRSEYYLGPFTWEHRDRSRKMTMQLHLAPRLTRWYIPEDGRSRFLRNVGNFLPDTKASYPLRKDSLSP